MGWEETANGSECAAVTPCGGGCGCAVPLCWGPAWYAQALIGIYAYEQYLSALCRIIGSTACCLGYGSCCSPGCGSCGCC